jgi:hypothetical protein
MNMCSCVFCSGCCLFLADQFFSLKMEPLYCECFEDAIVAEGNSESMVTRPTVIVRVIDIWCNIWVAF